MVGNEMENIDFENVKDEQAQEQELDLDGLQRKFVKSPAVGEETEVMIVDKVIKTTKTKAKDKEGNEFDTALSSVDFRIDIYTDKGTYSPSSWEVWGKIKQLMVEKKMIKGLKFKVRHVADGMKDVKAKKEKRCWEVVLVE